jgi:cohesin complex subunit SA-1/2
MSAFLRAIRAGVINPRHGAIFLAHYGRLGHSFDLCCKVVVDMLREEGMFNDNGEVVAEAIIQAIQEVSFIVFPEYARELNPLLSRSV